MMIITPTLISLFLIVFVLLFLFLNTIDKRKWLTAIISIILTPVAYFYVFYPFINIFSSYHHQKYFNSKTWTESPDLRYEMITHTMSSDTLIGATKKELEQLLGPAEWYSWNTETNAHNDNQWNYGLGIKPGAFNDKVECIEITLKDNAVIRLKAFQQDISY